MVKNKHLDKAKAKKDDEYYTYLADIEKELKRYKKHFDGKIVFCNCDDPETSNFWEYFRLKFNSLKLKKLIATHYEEEKSSYKLEKIENDAESNPIPLKENGDFRSDECVELLKEADIVVTNPPFSLFREYITQLMEHNKEFVIIANENTITYKDIFKLLKDNKIWIGYTKPKVFFKPDGTTKTFGNICWFTNLKIKRLHEPLILYKSYYENKSEYPKYDNYDAINISYVKDIPKDYDGAMGVPVSFMNKYSPDQFEILGNEYDLNIDKGRGYINGKRKYGRVFIRNKNPMKGEL